MLTAAFTFFHCARGLNDYGTGDICKNKTQQQAQETDRTCLSQVHLHGCREGLDIAAGSYPLVVEDPTRSQSLFGPHGKHFVNKGPERAGSNKSKRERSLVAAGLEYGPQSKEFAVYLASSEISDQ